jgi:8-oxo-dGTP pyrophosphatase MutT (NUDIX family)
MVWKPHVTVAAVVERDGKFLLVEEETDEGIQFNQPAGHLEHGETLEEAVVREVLEETGYAFAPRFLVGIHHWRHPGKDFTYLRFAFGGEITGYDVGRALDAGIIGPRWFTFDEIRANADRHRSPMILSCIEDWQSGRRHPLELVTYHA